MLVKKPQRSLLKWIKRGGIALLVAEGVAFAVSYGLWHSINTNRDHRKYLRDNYPSLLDYYYKFGETIDSKCQVRQIDYAYWDAEH